MDARLEQIRGRNIEYQKHAQVHPLALSDGQITRIRILRLGFLYVQELSVQSVRLSDN